MKEGSRTDSALVDDAEGIAVGEDAVCAMSVIPNERVRPGGVGAARVMVASDGERRFEWLAPIVDGERVDGEAAPSS